MELFKKIDFWIQVLLIIICTFAALLHVVPFYYAYFIVGSWQVLSTLIHLLQRSSFFPVSGRRIYCFLLIGIGLAGLICMIEQNATIVYLFTLLIISPLMAIWYAYMCFVENKTLERKAYVHLK